MKKRIIYFLAIAIFAMTGCQKELSIEGSNAPAKASLQSDINGDCLPKTVNGVYIAGTALVPATNTITVQLNVTKTGTYVVYTDTVNGFFFRATGSFTTLGANTVTLRSSSGIPFAAIPTNFVVRYDTTFCDIQVTVLPAGTGPAVFSLVSGGTPTNCASADTNGIYIKDAPVNASNSVDIMVNVTSVGTYTIRATGGGMTFQKTAAFTITGNQTVNLPASGTPTTAGANTITFDAPFASCNFTVTVIAPVAGTLGGAPGVCTPIIPTGTYTQGVVPPAGNTVQVQITTSAVGPYSVFTDVQGGLSFSASGTSNGATQTITLLNNGVAPTVSGPRTFTVTFGTSSCTFVINVGAAVNNDHFPLTANSWWSYDDVDGIFVSGDSLTRLNINPITLAGNVYRIFQNQDETTPFDSSYYRRSGNDYIERNDVDYYTAVISFDVPQKGDILFLKEGLTTNQTWESAVFTGTVSAVPVSLKYTFTCTDANGTATINGKNFTNVYKIAWRPKFNPGTGYQDEFVAFESWYAAGVGLIYLKIIDLSGGPSSDINILNWRVF